VVTTVLAWSVTLCLLAMLGRVAQLQISPSQQLKDQMEPRVSVKPDPPLRGDIMDRNCRVLAASRFGYRVVIDPVNFPEKNQDAALVNLAEAVGMNTEDVATRILKAIETNRQRAAAQQTRATTPTPPAPLAPAAVGSMIREVAMSTEVAQGLDDDAVGADATKPRGPIRYLPLTGVLSPTQVQAVRDLKLKGVIIEKRPVREYPGGDEVASIIGKVGFEDNGLMGLERLLETSLDGTKGSLRYVRDAGGRPLWMYPGSVQPAVPGRDVRLSIDLEMQRIGNEELNAQVDAQNAAGGRLVIADPSTGEILAMVDVVRDLPDLVPFPWEPAPAKVKGKGAPAKHESKGELPPRRYRTIKEDPARRIHPGLARNRCIEDIYEPGSTFKPFVWSTITELGLVKVDEVIDTEGGRWTMHLGSHTRYIEDVTKRATMTWHDVLTNSSNIGMIKGAARLSPAQLHDAVVRFGFGKPTGLGVPGKPFPGEASGIVTRLADWNLYTHTSVPYGHEVSVTPVQMVRAFSAFAREGELAGTLPRLRFTALNPGDSEGVIYRVLPEEIALLTRDPMCGVVENMEKGMVARHEPVPEGGWRYRMFGKSGTAEIPLGGAPKDMRSPYPSVGYFPDQFNSSFIAAGPAESPRLVVLVVIDDPGPRPGPRNLRYGSAAAGPCARRIMERCLTYMGVPPSPQPTPKPEDKLAGKP
jgi:cell division protein FtsI (penicillin-binding protein 3)